MILGSFKRETLLDGLKESRKLYFIQLLYFYIRLFAARRDTTQELIPAEAATRLDDRPTLICGYLDSISSVQRIFR